MGQALSWITEMTLVKKQAIKIQDSEAGTSCTIIPVKAGTAWDYPPGCRWVDKESKMPYTWMARQLDDCLIAPIS